MGCPILEYFQGNACDSASTCLLSCFAATLLVGAASSALSVLLRERGLV